MIENPEIAALRADLERLGNVVAPHRDHLCVRLPLFASVRVRIDSEGRLDCQPMFGPLPQMPALLFSTTLLTAATLGSLYFTGVSALSFGTAFLAIVSGVANAWRFVVTESCITRVQLLWAERIGLRAAARSALSHASPPTLRAGELRTEVLTPEGLRPKA